MNAYVSSLINAYDYTANNFYDYANECVENNSKVKTLVYNGYLRIAWSYDMKYNKNIDLIFFPQENLYLNYAYLYAKDFAKNIESNKTFYDAFVELDKFIIQMHPQYNINYDFAKNILLQAGLDKNRIDRFYNVRFGSAMFVPMEIEFEWYIVTPRFLSKYPISFFNYDRVLRYAESDEITTFGICIGIIKSYSILSLNTKPNYDYKYPLAYDIEIDKYTTYKDIFSPIPTTALAITQTNFNDYVVNVRDKPAKDSKILSQLFSQKLKSQMTDKSNDILQRQYYEINKSQLINPLWKDEYIVFIHNILQNNWVKVWVLKIPNKSNINKNVFDEEDIFNYKTNWDWYLLEIIKFISDSKDYVYIFNNHPSRLILYDGYIHTSGLDYLMPFGENYIKR
ncbi:hypothetical protein DCO58_07515 [Helicobacter saguini]|uniref:Uncharacterized protein n=1 Tax=Helicobacter saguini TaxID=1548018 RepID=A0A347VNC5_9HELI|nr:hypothetical protein [Helicobacter saguini]MWV61820.1 hypothetical protein [Helicobacter saguini]MWV67505.1 hypothetical protein [Helicobacter saguini]MWV69856.1 hypothetical protein [Helicobacter saguini]MWV72926.1 hypothetical protein [Helicobacter saguini]TLD93278.1 hypothetical protein LS64_009195 [Helicobacter saguini]